jgi:hypothetical protein
MDIGAAHGEALLGLPFFAQIIAVLVLGIILCNLP